MNISEIKEVELVSKYYPIGGMRLTLENTDLSKNRIKYITDKYKIKTNKYKNKFTKDDIEIIKTYYEFGEMDKILELIPNKNEQQIRLKANSLGLKAPIEYWTEEEDRLIKEYYPSNGYKKLIKILEGRTKSSIQSRASILGVKQMEYNENYFNSIDSSNKAYWLGFIYADGFVHNKQYKFGIELSSIDRSHLEKFSKELNSNIRIKERERVSFGKLRKFSRIEIKNKTMVRDLYRLGVKNGKTYNVKFPDKSILSKEYVHDFIRGVFDGDGTVCVYKNGMYLSVEASLVSASIDFLNGIKHILYTMYGIESNIYKKGESEKIYILRIFKKRECKRFIEKIYFNSNEENRLDRKYKKVKEVYNYC